MRKLHSSRIRLKSHFKHKGIENANHAETVAQWMFQRPRPWINTDAAVLHGLLDPSVSDAKDVLHEIETVAAKLEGGVLTIIPQGGKQNPELAEVLSHRSESLSRIT